MKKLMVIVLALVSGTLFSRDITTLSGTSYTNATVLEANDFSLAIMYKDASGRSIFKQIYFTDLPDDIKKEFKYAPEKTEAQKAVELRKQEEAKQEKAKQEETVRLAKIREEENLAKKYTVNDGNEAHEKGDYKTALAIFQKLAEAGNPIAQFNMAILYENGHGVEKDCQQAFSWYKKAADQGYANAQRALGVMYYNGEGIQKNKSEGIRLMRMAAKQGDADAMKRLDKLGESLNDNQKTDNPAGKQANAFSSRDALAQYFLNKANEPYTFPNPSAGGSNTVVGTVRSSDVKLYEEAASVIISAINTHNGAVLKGSFIFHISFVKNFGKWELDKWSYDSKYEMAWASDYVAFLIEDLGLKK